jgi:NAD-dependent dihydropyrimidine dehydrogenase PreA subunit
MNGIIFYHSNSGQTRLVCEFLARQLPDLNWTLAEISASPRPDLASFDRVGIATWTYYMGLPPLLLDFIHNLPQQNGKPAFALTTFGMMPGQSLKRLAQELSQRGFTLGPSASLHCPENYPPFVLKGKGWDGADAPTAQEQLEFNRFIGQLKTWLPQGQPTGKPKIGLLNTLMRPTTPQKARKEMGPLRVDAQSCTACGTCAQVCQYGAVRMQNQPVFDPAACQACWNCFNHCPQQALSTAKVGPAGQFSGPSPEFLARLAA